MSKPKAEQLDKLAELDESIQREVMGERSAYEVAMDSMSKEVRDGVLQRIRRHRSGELGLKSWRALSRAIVKTYSLKVNVHHFANYLKGLE